MREGGEAMCGYGWVYSLCVMAVKAGYLIDWKWKIDVKKVVFFILYQVTSSYL